MPEEDWESRNERNQHFQKQIKIHILNHRFKIQIQLVEWFKWKSICLASVKPQVQTPVLPKKRKVLKYKFKFILPNFTFSLTYFYGLKILTCTNIPL
jgi:hypothetical protein